MDWGGGGLNASAQTPGGVVIRERVAVQTVPVAPAETGLSPTASRWSGGVRGRGTLRVSLGSAELLRQPLETLSFRVTTTDGQTASASLAGAGTLIDQRTLCEPNATPGDGDDTWQPCALRKYAVFEPRPVLVIRLGADEWPDSLTVTGPGVDYRGRMTLDDPTVYAANIFRLTLGCGWTYAFENGGISGGNCSCIAAAPAGYVHGALALVWAFEPDPAEALAVTVAPEALVYQADGSPSQTSRVDVQAVYADGTPAPYPGGDLTYSVPTSPFGSLVSTWCFYGCSEQARGSSLTGGYRTGLSVAYRADGIGGSATTPPARGPGVDLPLPLTVTGGGLSGTAPLVLGSRLRLDLVADPSALPNGGAAQLYATVRGAGASNVPANSTLTFTLADPPLGTLYRRSTRQWGTSISGVSQRDAARGDVTFNRDCTGPASPGGTAHITSVLDGWSTLFSSATISVGARLGDDAAGPALDTLFVSISPSQLAPGDSAVVSVTAPEAGGCGSGGSVIADSTRMSVISFAGPFGLLEHNGVRSRIISNITWGELRAGEVRFVAAGAIPCAADTVGILVSGPGFMGAGSVVVQADSQGGASRGTDTPMCTSRISLVETIAHLKRAFKAECPNLASATNTQIQTQYERTLARYLFGGMGWGPLQEYTYSTSDGLDGYLRWGVDTDGRRYPQVSAVMEAKMVDNRPIYGATYSQALNHINFLADQRTAFRQAFLANHPNGVSFTFGDPVLIYVSQSQGNDDFAWRVGSPPFTRANGTVSLLDYEPLVLNHANSRHVTIIHARMVNALGYRTLLLRYKTPLRIIDPESPLMDWLSSQAAVDLRNFTFSTVLPIGLECSPNPTRRESPPPPGWSP